MSECKSSDACADTLQGPAKQEQLYRRLV